MGLGRGGGDVGDETAGVGRGLDPPDVALLQLRGLGPFEVAVPHGVADRPGHAVVDVVGQRDAAGPDGPHGGDDRRHPGGVHHRVASFEIAEDRLEPLGGAVMVPPVDPVGLAAVEGGADPDGRRDVGPVVEAGVTVDDPRGDVERPVGVHHAQSEKRATTFSP